MREQRQSYSTASHGSYTVRTPHTAPNPGIRRAFNRGALLTAACFILYITVGGAIATHLVASSLSMVELDLRAQTSPGQALAAAGNDIPSASKLSEARVGIGITVGAHADCALSCESFSAHRTTTNISTDWILVSAAEFGELVDQLGCNSEKDEYP
jgi:hypothetical protein